MKVPTSLQDVPSPHMKIYSVPAFNPVTSALLYAMPPETVTLPSVVSMTLSDLKPSGSSASTTWTIACFTDVSLVSHAMRTLS